MWDELRNYATRSKTRKRIARDVEEEVPTALSQDVTRESYIVLSVPNILVGASVN